MLLTYDVIYFPGSSNLGKYLASVDSAYNSLFMDSLWRDTFDKTENKLGMLKRYWSYIRVWYSSHLCKLDITQACCGSQIFSPWDFTKELKENDHNSFVKFVSL